MKKIFAIFVFLILFINHSYAITGDTNFGTIDFETALEASGAIDPVIAGFVPIAQDNSLAELLSKKIPWFDIVKSFEMKGISLGCLKYTIEKCKQGKIKGCLEGGLIGFPATITKPSALVEIVQNPKNFRVLGLRSEGRSSFLKFGGSHDEGRRWTYIHMIPFPIFDMILSSALSKGPSWSAEAFCLTSMAQSAGRMTMSNLLPHSKNSFMFWIP